MFSLNNNFNRIYGNVTNSIAFYPSIISAFFILFAALMLYLEKGGIFNFLRDHFSILFIDNLETARVILATLISGIITLTVFSFSMVMVLLNQASTNFSPRLLPGLISDKRNQGVLGIYIGSLVYNIFVLISIKPTQNNFTGIGLSVLIGILMGILCLGFFVFFIHTISTSIQINNILTKTFKKAKSNLEDSLNDDQGEWTNDCPDIASWKTVYTSESGYYQHTEKENLINYLEKEKTNLIVALRKGLYILKAMPLVYVEKNGEKKSAEDIRKMFNINKSIDVNTNYLLGIKHLTEVGVKAMSPGINDPGTAISTLDYLAELFQLRLKIKDYKKYFSEDHKYYLIIPEVPFENLLHDTLAAYRTYANHDFNLVQKLQSFLLYLRKEAPDGSSYKTSINNQLVVLQETYMSSISNKQDLDILKKQLET